MDKQTQDEESSPAFVSVGDNSINETPVPSSSSGSVAGTVVDMFQRSSHPKAAVFHVIFKAAAVTIYVLSKFFTISWVQLFVVVVILSALDFWTVKNITGRLMVGLRWWNETADNGETKWRYESIEDQASVSAIDYALFWYSLYLSGMLWVVFGFIALLKFDVESALLCVVCAVLLWSNIYGFWNCSAHARSQVKNAVQQGIQQGTLAALTGQWFSWPRSSQL